MQSQATLPASIPTRRRTRFELWTGYLLIQLVLWTPRPWQQRLYLVAAVFLLVALWRQHLTPERMGLRLQGLIASSWVVAAALALAVVAVLVALHAGTLHPERTPGALFRRYYGYALWSFAQQILLQVFFLERFLRLVPSRTGAALAAATIFAAAHLPSPILAPVTFVWGFTACVVFLRHRNLIPLAIAHAILGVTVSTTLPPTITHNMRVGLGYLLYPHRTLHW